MTADHKLTITIRFSDEPAAGAETEWTREPSPEPLTVAATFRSPGGGVSRRDRTGHRYRPSPDTSGRNEMSPSGDN